MLTLILALLVAAPAVDSDQLPADFQPTISRHKPGGASDSGGSGVLGRQANGSVLGIDTLPSFSSYFYFPGLVETSFGAFPQWTWPYTMVGRAPFGQDSSERTTVINTPIIPVILDLRNSDGSPRFFTRADGTKVRMILDGRDNVDNVLKSPVFQNARYGSSERPTQIQDAIHRAQFFHQSEDDWHTLLRPDVKSARTMVLIRGTYQFSVNPTTGKLNYVLVDQGVFGSLLFPPSVDDTSTLIGGAEHAGDMKPTDMTLFLFNNTYLADFSTGDCCVLGFHSYDVEPGDAANGWREKHYVINYASWITPGIFGGGFSDVTAVSHELMETYSDPFVNNATPIWLAPNGLCQANLESGDVIEGLSNATFPMTMNGYTYHPQNEALLQWFAGQTPSSAYKHAYSYPDVTVLPTAAVSQAPGCSGPANVAQTR